MTLEYYVPDWMLKRAAKQLSRQYDINHSRALDRLAQEQGFLHWTDLRNRGDYVWLDENPNDLVCIATSKIASSLEYQ